MKKQQGFTLIELLVVIAIIGLLSTLAVVALGNARVKARDAKRQSDLKVFQTGIELYLTENDRAPILTDFFSNGTDDWDGTGTNASTLTTVLAEHLPGGLPQDPQSRKWMYCVDASGSDYIVANSLEQNTNVAGDIDGDPAWDAAMCIVSNDGLASSSELDCDDSEDGQIDDATINSQTVVCLGQANAA